VNKVGSNPNFYVNNITVYRNGKLIWGQEPSSIPINQTLKVYANSKSKPNSNTIRILILGLILVLEYFIRYPIRGILTLELQKQTGVILTKMMTIPI
jgi:hypothetical protein